MAFSEGNCNKGVISHKTNLVKPFEYVKISCKNRFYGTFDALTVFFLIFSMKVPESVDFSHLFGIPFIVLLFKN